MLLGRAAGLSEDKLAHLGDDPLPDGLYAPDEAAIVRYARLHPTAIALVQLGAIVGGHLLGIVAAHERALSMLAPRASVRGQWPLLAVMVGYTVAGLLLLFSP